MKRYKISSGSLVKEILPTEHIEGQSKNVRKNQSHPLSILTAATEIDNFDSTSLWITQQNILRLQVTVDYFHLVQERESLTQLRGELKPNITLIN